MNGGVIAEKGGLPLLSNKLGEVADGFYFVYRRLHSVIKVKGSSLYLCFNML